MKTGIVLVAVVLCLVPGSSALFETCPKVPDAVTEFTPGMLLGSFAKAINEKKPIMVDVAWEGCSGCENVVAGDYLNKDPMVDGSGASTFVKANVPWKVPKDAHAATTTFHLWIALTQGQTQFLRGGKAVENYLNGFLWQRPHFPQLVAIDYRHINTAALDSLCQLASKKTLFGLNNGILDSAAVNNAVYGLFRKGAILVQLLNENLFKTSAQNDWEDKGFKATVACVLEHVRSPIVVDQPPRHCPIVTRAHPYPNTDKDMATNVVPNAPQEVDGSGASVASSPAPSVMTPPAPTEQQDNEGSQDTGSGSDVPPTSEQINCKDIPNEPEEAACLHVQAVNAAKQSGEGLEEVMSENPCKRFADVQEDAAKCTKYLKDHGVDVGGTVRPKKR